MVVGFLLYLLFEYMYSVFKTNGLISSTSIFQDDSDEFHLEASTFRNKITLADVWFSCYCKKKFNCAFASVPKLKKRKLHINQEVDLPYIAPHLIQIKATNEEIYQRIEKFTDRKRNEINVSNIAEFCSGDRNSEFTCARIDATLKKQKDSKGHLQVGRVLNAFFHRDQLNSDYLKKYIPKNGIEERLENLETQLSLTKCVPANIYNRLKLLEDRMLKLESISPEYIQFWENGKSFKSVKKRIFSLEEVDGFIEELEAKT